MPGTLRLILGDQLTRSISSLRDLDAAADIVLMCEVAEEATYVRHHKRKIAFLFSAMRHFEAELSSEGVSVRYIRLEDEGNTGSLRGEVERAVAAHKPDRIFVTEPGEYRLRQDFASWEADFGLPVEVRPDDRFLCSLDEFETWAKGKKSFLMENFYRMMRRKHGILMDGTEPVGGAWNFDKANRDNPGPPDPLFLPRPPSIKPDTITQEVLELVGRRFREHFGDLEPFNLAVIREDALAALDAFVEERLPRFGLYQDVMVQGEPILYHSFISFYLNCGLLLPKEIVQRAEDAYRAGKAPIEAVEGFIRQFVGWREYVRGLYWRLMPDWATENFFSATRPLPWFYWSSETDLNCVRQCVADTRRHAYAHHIQRLMVLGNFALLAGIDPAEVNEWFLVVYADAYEWVELPNVTGMALFADGGRMSTKPYAASGAYINRMSDYCKGCRFDVKKKTGPDACPFNYLYWDFLIRNRLMLEKNTRMGMAYNTLRKMPDDQKKTYQADAKRFLEGLKIQLRGILPSVENAGDAYSSI